MIPMNIIKIYENYNSYFDSDLKALFELISKVASDNSFKIYLIGGMVRDLLLNQKSLDIDITVEGNAIDFAHVLENKANAKILSIHDDFGTVKIEINGKKVDFASTRSEIYPKKGQLPLVETIGCPLKEDVLRRDFTINSLAMSLNKDSFADLIDFVDGFDDLNNKKIRILHDKSFIDDPTRIIRALKYASRLNFELDEKTLNLQSDYLKNINYDMCYKRVKQEFKKTFEHAGQETFNKFINQKIYKLLTKKEVTVPIINIDKLCVDYKPKHPWLIYLGYVAAFEAETFCDNLELTKSEKNIIEDAKNLIEKTFSNDFEIYKAFCSLQTESIIIYACIGDINNAFRFLNYLKKIKLSIDGNDIIKLGFTPSKKFSEGLDFVLEKKLKNPDLNKTEELELISNYLSTSAR